MNRLFATLRAMRPLLEEPGVLIVGPEVPNLLQPGAASTLVVSQDIDIGIYVDRHAAVKRRLGALSGFRPSADEPSVLVSQAGDLLEVNFVGMDPARDPTDTYLLDDLQLPLMVFGPLSLVRPGPPLEIEGIRLPLPRPAGLILEKLITDRTGEKGDRDLLVALGLLMTASPDDLLELDTTYHVLDLDHLGALVAQHSRSSRSQRLPKGRGLVDCSGARRCSPPVGTDDDALPAARSP